MSLPVGPGFRRGDEWCPPESPIPNPRCTASTPLLFLALALAVPAPAIAAAEDPPPEAAARPVVAIRVDRRRRPLPRHRGEHEVAPDLRRQAAAGHALHRRAVVVADPDPGDQVAAPADEPRVAIVGGGAGLAVGGQAQA